MRGDEIARPVILRERRLCEMRTISQITPIDTELFKKAPTFINCHFRQQQRELVSFDKTCDRLVEIAFGFFCVPRSSASARQSSIAIATR
jgi:hypothetical protein